MWPFSSSGPDSPCVRVRDELLSDADRAASPSEACRRHLAGCPDCRELAEALAVIERVSPSLAHAAPPEDLVQRTLARLEPHWKRPERNVSRQEYRMIWSGALGVAGAAAAVAVIVADFRGSAGSPVAAEGLVRVGMELLALQMFGGAVLAVVLLAIRAMKAGDHQPRHRPPDQDRGGRD